MIPARLLEYEGDPRSEPAVDELAQLPVQVATLTSDVEYIKRDVSEIKVTLLRMDEKLGSLDACIHENEKSLLQVEKGIGERLDGVDKRLTASIDGVEMSLTEKIDGVDKRLTASIGGVEMRLTEKIDGVDKRLTAGIDGVEMRLTEKIVGGDKHLMERIDGVEIRLAGKIDGAKLWAMGLYVAQGAGLLFVMAKGLKWI